jgi:uncharacterized protein
LVPRWPGTVFEGWRGLGRFWIGVGLVILVGGVTLKVLGPLPAPPPRITANPPTRAAQPPATVQPQVPPKQAAAPAPPGPGRDTPGPIPDPDPALQEPVGGNQSDLVPRVADDGRMPMQVYAAGFDASTRRPRVGLLLAGVGLNQADSEAAIRTLPGGITLAFSPYAADPAKLLAAARMAEHEYLLSIPMEPQGFPLNDPGSKALMTSLPPEQNHQRLEWALSRIAGYVGTTGALGSLRGERFASLPEQVNPVLAELARRGLLYVDARQGAAPLPFAWGRAIDLVIDEPPAAADIDDKLGRLVRLARDKGSALGLATVVRPVTTARIAAWSNGLASDGLALAPVSALARPPPAAKPAR